MAEENKLIEIKFSMFNNKSSNQNKENNTSKVKSEYKIKSSVSRRTS